MGRKLRAFGLVTVIDKAALAAYCQAWGRWVEAEQQLRKYGPVIKSPSGFPIQSPYLTIANKAMEQMTRMLVEFGMTPSSRSRVATVKTQPKEDRKARFFTKPRRELLRAA
jgi:P27 family predicted phage terminase small subunit